MRELIQRHNHYATTRWQLMTGACALALISYVSFTDLAEADDSSRPQVWIELGGQLSRLDNGQDSFDQNFPNSPQRPSIFSPSQKYERPPRYSFDELGSISIQPENSDWILSATVQYGRSTSRRHIHQQTNPKAAYTTKYDEIVPSIPPGTPKAARFSDTDARNGESHLVLDFKAGKDIGLGMFGDKAGSSVVAMGVRFAQFSSRSNVALKSDPDFHFSYKYPTPHFKFPAYQPYHSNMANLVAVRSFHGVGPSLSWNASAALAGNTQDSELTFDWGVNAAVLFGRQRTKVHHQATGQYASAVKYPVRHITYQPQPVDQMRSHSVTVPNVGGFAGLSFRYSNAKVSFGYRGDFFFGAIDGGIDHRKSESIGFYGPFAAISIGLGG